MTEIELHALLAWALVGLGVVTALALIFVSAPYGRHGRGGWGPSIPSRLGWVLMESPAVLLFAWVYASGAHRAELVPLVLLGVWQLHYVNRTFVFPLRMRAQGKTIPLSIAAMALAFNILNAWLNARWISLPVSSPLACRMRSCE